MEERMKVVFVKFGDPDKARKAYMFEGYRHCYLEVGDTVIVPGPDDEEAEATIVAIENYNMEYQTDKDALEECLMVAGVKLPLKRIIGKVERTYFDWEGKKE